MIESCAVDHGDAAWLLMDQLQTPVVAERLTWDETCRRYVNEWVVVVEADWGDDDGIDFVSAVVFGHAPTRKEASPIVKRAFETHEDVGCFFTGSPSLTYYRFMGT